MHGRRKAVGLGKLVSMEYMVTGSDGKEYGPVNFSTLVEWAKEDRVRPGSKVRDMATGREMAAADVPGLFASQPNMTPEPNPGDRVPMSDAQRPMFVNTGDFAWAIIDSVLAVLMVFAFGGLGILFAIFAIVNAFRANQEGHPMARLALACSFLATALVMVGWIVRAM